MSQVLHIFKKDIRHLWPEVLACPCGNSDLCEDLPGHVGDGIPYLPHAGRPRRHCDCAGPRNLVGDGHTSHPQLTTRRRSPVLDHSSLSVAETPCGQIPVSRRLPLLALPHRTKSPVARGRLSSVVVSAWPVLQSVPDSTHSCNPNRSGRHRYFKLLESSLRPAGHNGLHCWLRCCLVLAAGIRYCKHQRGRHCLVRVVLSLYCRNYRAIRHPQSSSVTAACCGGFGGCGGCRCFPVARVGTCSRRIPSVFRRLVARRSPRIQFQFVAPRHCIRQQ